MNSTVKQKTLDHGAILYLACWQLDQDEAEALGRPVGSEEYTLRLETPHGGRSTSPSASWYLTKEDFQTLFDAIKYELHYDNAARVLDNVESEEDATRAKNTPLGLKGIVLSAFSHKILEKK